MAVAKASALKPVISLQLKASMDDLPPHLILEILVRLKDSADVASCRVVSKTLNVASHGVRSINLSCTLQRYLRSRSPESKPFITPFKTVFNDLVRNSRCILQSISISAEKRLGVLSLDDVVDESDDLYLTDVSFVKDWLVTTGGELKSLSISDFWRQSCWRRSDVLGLISSYCHSLVGLELRNAWLSVDGLNPMPKLTSLTLGYTRLDDENLQKVNDCFPCLQVLNLIEVGWLREPTINLVHLRFCRLTSQTLHSLTIFGPNLVKLELKCRTLQSLVLETPLLFDLYLSVEKAHKFEAKEFRVLDTLRLESANLYSLVRSFPHGKLIKRLVVDLLNCISPVEMKMVSTEVLFDVFPNVKSVTLGAGAWSEMETSFLMNGFRVRNDLMGLTEIVAQLVIYDVEVTLSFISCLLDRVANLSDIGLLIHPEVDPDVARTLLARCTAFTSCIRWRWGLWKEDTEDSWNSDGLTF